MLRCGQTEIRMRSARGSYINGHVLPDTTNIKIGYHAPQFYKDMMQKSKNETDKGQNPFQILKEELNEALSLYWTTATEILHKSGITVLPPDSDYFSTEKNFFSALFLYSYFRMNIPKSRRILYAAANQCLRGMVTGCDNILDNEYKTTLETDLPQQATLFRSVLDIMVSDRVLFAILQKGYVNRDLAFDQIQTAIFASLRALVKSGAQEASEAGGINDILSPNDILNKIHHYKTGILFQSPWALPDVIDTACLKDTAPIKNALFQIGMGCQILDDMVDMSMDLRMHRHNYVVSLIQHGKNTTEKTALDYIRKKKDNIKEDRSLLLDFPHAEKTAAAAASSFLEKGIRTLFSKEHQFMTEMAINMITQRIGADIFPFDTE